MAPLPLWASLDHHTEHTEWLLEQHHHFDTAPEKLAGCPQEGVGGFGTPHWPLCSHASGQLGDTRSMGRSDPAAPHAAALHQFCPVQRREVENPCKTSHLFLLTDFVASGNVSHYFFIFPYESLLLLTCSLFFLHQLFSLCHFSSSSSFFILPKLPSFTNHLLCHFCPPALLFSMWLPVGKPGCVFVTWEHGWMHRGADK